MLKQILLISIQAYVLFALEILLNDVLGAWFKPQLLLVLIVFWGLYAGIRYSLYAAFLGGLFKDSYSILPFGTYLFVYVVSAFLATIVRQGLYQPGSRFSRAVVTFFVLIGTFVLQALLYLMSHDTSWIDMLMNIFFPQLLATMVIVTWMFYWLGSIAKYFKI